MSDFVEYDPDRELVLKIPRQSTSQPVVAIGLVLHHSGEMSVSGPLDSPAICGKMFEGAWQAIKKLRGAELKQELTDQRIEIATAEALDRLGVKRLNR